MEGGQVAGHEEPAAGDPAEGRPGTVALGWTMAAGSGRVLADILSGRRADIDLEGLILDRYGAGSALRSGAIAGAHA
jgi:D-amino-acid dehydrogenase